MSSKLIAVFDKDDLFNNAITALSLDVEEVFYIHHHRVDLESMENLETVINRYKDIRIQFLEITDDQNDIDNLLSLSEDTIVDVGGEKYLSLVLFERALRRSNPVIYYDDEENKIKSYRKHEVLVDKVFSMTIEDIINLGGGKIQSTMHKNIDLNDKESVHILNTVMEQSFSTYSQFTSFVARINSMIVRKNAVNGRKYELTEKQKEKILADEGYRRYQPMGLLDVEEDYLVFPTRKIAQMFEVSGAFLENYLYLKLTGSHLFDDVMMSCVIDFSGSERRYPIMCEIDCLVIKDNHLLFTSCKSNKVDTGALNEIKVHNTMFGNKLSAPVLCTIDDLDEKSPSVYAKGKELGVAVIDQTSFKNDHVAEDFLAIIEDTYTYENEYK